MLYGNLIFIKKTGGDGSKFPVTEKNIKIGRSEDCSIRIYTPQVAPEHFQLIIDCNGQAKLRNLFTPTILNGKPLGQGDVTLCHGDVFKLGERLARWEYLPTSKYFKQLLSPTGRLVAVVNPQRRSNEISGTSATQTSGSKSTPLGSKRKFSEKFGSENSSMAKQRRTVGSDASFKPKIDLNKLLIGRHSIKTGKSILKTPMLKQRKSVSGIINSRTPKNKAENHRKSTLPSWKTSVDAGPKQSTTKKSPSKWPVKTPSKRSLKNEVRTPSKSTPIKVKMPKRLNLDTKSGDKTLLNTILESPPKSESIRSTRSFSKSPPVKVLLTPKRKSPVQVVRLVQSEKKLKATPKCGGFRKMSLILKKVDQDGEKSLLRKSAKEKRILSVENESQVQISSSKASNVSDGRKSSRSDRSFNSSKKTSRKSVKSTTKKTPRNLNKPSNRSSVKKAAIEIARTPPLIDLSYEVDSVNSKQTFRESVISSRKNLKKSVRKSSARSVDIFQTPEKFLKNARTPSPEKTREELQRPVVASPASTPTASRKSRNASSSKKLTSLSKGQKATVRRKLSPSLSSAERAAKKLKTSSPKKPDKNKRAALLVLGKANRKQLLSQNVKVLLKQKIVKKAIKQSVALPIFKDEKKKTSIKKIRKKLQKKKKKASKVSSPSRISQLVKESPASNKVMEKSINESENDTPNVKKSPERNSLNKSKMSSPLPSAKVATPNTEALKSITKSSKKAESILSPKSSNETISPFIKFDKSSESYVFSSSRRCSKRLSSKNDIERPDFVELSPSALGLIPKNIEMFKTPKEKKRKSLSLVTPRSNVGTGIIKSASTSKIGNRKSVSFSSKDFSVSTTAYTPTLNEKTDFDFDSFHTSNITMDVFVSPLNKSSSTPVVEFVTDENVEPSEKRSTSGTKKVARKLLQSPQNDRASKSSKFSDEMKTPLTSVSELGVLKPVVSSRSRSNPKNDLTDVRGIKKLFATPKAQRSPKNDLSHVKGVKNLMQTPRVQKIPKNDLSDLRGVKKLYMSPKVQKIPKNDLSNVRGVKKLLATPKAQKSPKNDLSDVRGVKKLYMSPKVQKSPKNDLSNVRGVKKLLATPKAQKSPKNDLSDLRGIKKLMQTPKKQKSPRNELTDFRGVKKLLATPKAQKSPKNDLSDVRGVKKLLATPRAQKSPKNDLSDLRGIKKLMQTPKKQKSPRNELTDFRGVKKLLATPKAQKSPKNDLSDVRGVKKLLATPRAQKSPKNDLSDLRGIKKLMQTPKKQKSPRNELTDFRGVKRLLQSPKNQKSPKNDLTDVTGVKQLLRTPKTQKSPRNNLSDVEGVKELFASPPKPKSPSGATQKMNKTPKSRRVRKLSREQKPIRKHELNSVRISKLLETESKKSLGVSETKTKRGRKQKLDEGKDEKVATPKTRIKKGSAKAKTPRVTRNAKQGDVEKKVSKREAVGGGQTTRAKTAEPLKKATRIRVEAKKKVEAPKEEATKTLRKRKTVEPMEATPPKVRRKAAAGAKQSTLKEPKTVAIRSTARKEEKAKSSKKAPGKPKTPAKKAPRGQTEATKSLKSVSKTQKVQKGRSQTSVKQKSLKSEMISPRKTRAAAAKS